MSTDTLSPTALVQQKLTEAAWRAYEEAQRIYMEERRRSLLPHGKLTTYKRHGCRCAACAETYSQYAKQLRAKKILRQRLESPPQEKPEYIRPTHTPKSHKPIKHGTNAGYVRGKCRCEECTEAHRIDNQKYRKKPYKTHGKRWTYDRGCRCNACKRARREYDRARYIVNPRGGKRDNKTYRPSTEVKHGTEYGYTNFKCRCEECTRAATAASRRRRQRQRERKRLLEQGVER